MQEDRELGTGTNLARPTLGQTSTAVNFRAQWGYSFINPI